MVEKTFKSGAVIFREGTFEACMYALLEGTVGIYAHYGQQDEKLLTELKAEDGACFGEMGLVDGLPRSATAVALSEVRVEVITGEDFGAFFAENPQRIYGIMAQMGSRIRGLSQDYLEVCRAASEMVGAEGKEKSGWFHAILEKIRVYLDSEDVKEGLKLADSCHYASSGYYWV